MTTPASARRTTGRSNTSARLSMTLCHASLRKIRPTVHCGAYAVTGRVGNGQTEGARVAATQAEADIHLEGVTKRFADMTAVDDLTLSIPRGNFFAMLGPSGCGKTTTLRMIGGFENPDRRPRLPRRLRRHRRAALQARRQHRLSVLRALPAPDGREERRVRARAQEGLQGGDAQARRRRAGARAARPTCPSASPASSPAARRSASRSPARSSTARARCCSTSRSARSTCACASSCRSSSSGSSRTSGSRSCTSPTIRRRP